MDSQATERYIACTELMHEWLLCTGALFLLVWFPWLVGITEQEAQTLVEEELIQ